MTLCPTHLHGVALQHAQHALRLALGRKLLRGLELGLVRMHVHGSHLPAGNRHVLDV